MEEEFKVPTLPPIAPSKSVKANPVNATETEGTTASIVAAESENDRASRNYTCPYKVPPWSGPTPRLGKYAFEVLKSGQIIAELDELETQPFWTFGRSSDNHFELAHPTISRFHLILQYRPKVQRSEENGSRKGSTTTGNDSDKQNASIEGPPEGWYVYDLDSTHGSFLNKQRLPPRVYIRIRVGHILRLGGSTRSYILKGPCEDEEPEAELSVTELKAERQRQQEEQLAKQLDLYPCSGENGANNSGTGGLVGKGGRPANDGCNWGMAEDADEETDLTHNPYASTNNEELFLDDPKKTLRGYFEREGLQLEYKCDEMSTASFVCRVELPIDDAKGHPVIAEVVHKGRKKDCVVQCALEACRILDRYGVLRQANQEPRRRWNPAQRSDSDDDEFLDRTGDIARRKQRKANAAAAASNGAPMTHEALLKREQDLQRQLEEISNNIKHIQQSQQRMKAQRKVEGNEDLDSYMDNLKDCEPEVDRVEIRKLRQEEASVRNDLEKVKRLVQITKPTDYSFLKSSEESQKTADSRGESLETKTERKSLPLIGKRNQFGRFRTVSLTPATDNTSLERKVEEKLDKTEDLQETQHSEQDDDTKGQHKDDDEKVESKERVALVDAEETQKKSQDVITPSKQHHEIMEQTKTPNNMEDGSPATKRRRQRVRPKSQRPEDMDEDKEEYESSEKYVKWMPPKDQTGDGFTALNEKYGY